MRWQDRIWAAPYSVDRRGHHHRCLHCNRIVTVGEMALWVRLPWRRRGKTKVVHVEPCADLEIDGINWRDRFVIWAKEAA